MGRRRNSKLNLLAVIILCRGAATVTYFHSDFIKSLSVLLWARPHLQQLQFFESTGRFQPTLAECRSLQNIVLLHVQSKREAGQNFTSSFSSLTKRLQTELGCSLTAAWLHPSARGLLSAHQEQSSHCRPGVILLENKSDLQDKFSGNQVLKLLAEMFYLNTTFLL